MNAIFLEGMLLQAGLIFALGPQNLFVIESGIKRQHPVTVSIVCFLCDLFLILLGVAGAGSFLNYFPQLKVIVGFFGVAFLINYGLGKLRDIQTVQAFSEGAPTSRREAILRSISFSIINPHAYLDGIVLIGGYSAKYAEFGHRLCVGLGAASFSLIWFLLLSQGSGLLLPVFRNPQRMRWIMGSAGVCLLFLSAKLSADVIGWINELYPDHVTAFTLTWK